METKLRDEPFFLIAALCLFFPVGLILLLRSERSARFKWLSGILGSLVFFGLLSLALAGRPRAVDPESLQVRVTRETLSVGQSGGLLITNGDQYHTSYTVNAENDVLNVNNNLYTAVKPGSCTLTVSFGEEVRTVVIRVDQEPGTDTPVLASPNGARYHLTTAGHAGKKAVEMTEEEALQSGKTPCKNCYKK